MSLMTLLTRYKENHALNNQHNDALFEKSSQEIWVERVQTRSKTLRQTFKENEAIMKEIQQLILQAKQPEEMQELYDAALFLYDEAFDDFEILSQISKKLIPYYEDKDDLNHLLPILRLMGFETSVICVESNIIDGLTPPADYYQKIIHYAPRFEEITEFDARICIMNAYSNLISPIAFYNEDIRQQLFQIHDDMRAFYHNEKVQAIDGNNDDFKDAYNQAEEDFTSLILNIYRGFSIEEKQIIENHFKHEHMLDFSENIQTIRRLLSNDISYQEALEYFFSRFDAIQSLPKESDDEMMEYVDRMDNVATFIFSILKNYCKDIDEEEYYITRFVPTMRDVLQRVPYRVAPAIVNYICAEFYKNTSKYIPDSHNQVKFLQNMILFRQPTTYVHCLMVSKIATTIARGLIQEQPQLFTTLPWYGEEEQVRRWKRELLHQIHMSALLHDVGKCTMVEIINQQSRRLSNEEFAIIRFHPQYGVRFLLDNPAFKEYYDVMLGHHKYYNGQGGYPDDFDNTASAYRIIIDLITIADCMDAALDIYGRNYSEGKSFEALLEELKKDAGIRYHPDIVQFIVSHDELQRQLKYLTSSGRNDVYYEAYHQLMS